MWYSVAGRIEYATIMIVYIILAADVIFAMDVCIQ